MGKKDYYASHTDEELAQLPTVYREGLLEGRVVLVSGAAGGLGLAICMLFARLGATIVACGRDGKKLTALEEMLGAHGISCFSQAMTIREWRDMITFRGTAARDQTANKIRLRALLRTHGMEAPKGLWSRKGLAWLEANPGAKKGGLGGRNATSLASLPPDSIS